MTPNPIHATAVATYADRGWRGVLLKGASGAGKSDLALRLIAQGWRLVGDDYLHLWASAGRLYAAPVETLAGRIEARGLGIVAGRHRLVSRIVLAIDCIQGSTERMPEPDQIEMAGIELPRLDLDIRPASAVETVVLAIRRL